MTAIGEILRIVFDVSLPLAIVLGGSVIIAYTTAGGMWSVTITDSLQFVIMTVGVFFLLSPLGLFEVGGWQGLEIQLDVEHTSPVGVGTQEIFTLFVLYFFGMIVGQDIWQRVFIAQDDATARTGTLLPGVYSVAYGIVAAVFGMIALVTLDLQNDGGAFSVDALAVTGGARRAITLGGDQRDDVDRQQQSPRLFDGVNQRHPLSSTGLRWRGITH
jgi:solute:Na+ symporter, SSS family